MKTSLFGKPLYVLISSHTFSAGEAVAYDLQSLKLATFVGETTGGGANPGGEFPVGELFVFVPTGRAENPVTKSNWEGIGVKPDLPTAASDALRVALEKLGQKPSSFDIDTLSEAELFTPRSTQQPGTEAIARQAMVTLANGNPDYNLMEPGLAQATRQQLPNIQKMFTGLGDLKSVTFREVTPNGLDAYDMRFASGSLVYMLMLNDDGKIVEAWISRP